MMKEDERSISKSAQIKTTLTSQFELWEIYLQKEQLAVLVTGVSAASGYVSLNNTHVCQRELKKIDNR